MTVRMMMTGAVLALGLAACGGEDGIDQELGGVGAGPTLDPASFALEFVNNSGGLWRDDQIYFTIAGNDQPVDGRMTYLQVIRAGDMNMPDSPEDGLAVDENASVGLVVPVTHAENDDPGLCVKERDTCYPKLWFTLADLHDNTLYIPGDGRFYGTRIYMSYGKPMYMRVNPSDNGLVQLDVGNPNDVNFDTINDFFELTYDPYKVDDTDPANPRSTPVPFGANVTQVDGFAIPVDFTVKGHSGAVVTRGITVGAGSSSGADTRIEFIQAYLDNVSEPFRGLLQRAPDGTALRVVAPYKSREFQAGGKYAGFFDDYVEQLWRHYKTVPLKYDDQGTGHGNRFEGGVVTDANGQEVIRFSRYGVDGTVRGPYDLAKPNTFQLLTQNGPFANDAHQDLKDFYRDLSSAVLRHVALNTADWYKPERYYLGEPRHDYARFLHEVSIDNKAYAFGYDDAAHQSPVIILPDGENPERVIVRLNG